MVVPESERKYIQEGRRLFATRFPGGHFDDPSWDIRHLRASRHKTTNARVYFTRHGSTTDPLPERFAAVIKAFLLMMDSSGGTMPLRVDAARMLWKAVELRIGQREFAWADLSEQDLLDAEQQMLLSWGGAATYKRCTMLQKMVSDLAAAPFGPIVAPMKVVFRTPRHEDFERYTLEGQEMRQAKMPPDEAINAIGRMFADVVKDEGDRLILCALALLVATGFRVGEVLTLPVDCEVSDGSGADLKCGLRYYKEKSRGGEKRLAIHWMTRAQGELAKAAIREVRRITRAVRRRARELERDPATLPIPNVSRNAKLTVEETASLLGMKAGSLNAISANRLPALGSGKDRLYRAKDVMAYLVAIRGPLWTVDRRDGTFQSLSETLFIQFRNANHATRGTNRLLVDAVTEQPLNDFLGGRAEKGRTVVKSGFERYGIRDAKGQFYCLHTHQFRHWVTTKAAQAGVPDHVIARWQGREHMGDLEAYKHLTPAERLETLKAALKRGTVKGQIAQMYFSLAEDVRDVFLEGQLQAVHVTPLGLCVHDFRVLPCPKFLNCVKDCEDYVLDTQNKVHIDNLVQLQTRTQLTLDQARQQSERKQEDLSENWIADAEATLSGVTRILTVAGASTGTVQPFAGRHSKFERADG